MTFANAYNVIRSAYQSGLTGFGHSVQTLTPASTHKYKNQGCPQCGSLEHHHSEGPAGKLTRKQARAALIAIGKKDANKAALTAAGTDVTEFVAAVERAYR